MSDSYAAPRPLGAVLKTFFDMKPKTMQQKIELARLLDEAKQKAEDLRKLALFIECRDFEWHDCALEAPPSDRQLMLWVGRRIVFGYFNKIASQNKGMTLPNVDGEAVWHFDNTEGTYRIKYWAFIPPGPNGEV